MGRMRFNYRSQTLSQNVDITIVIPSNDFSYFDPAERSLEGVPNVPKKFIYKEGMKYQTIYLLHGGGDDETIFYRKTNVELNAERNCVMLVSPSFPNSYFADVNYGIDYSWFLNEELPVVIQSLFPSSPRREDTFIMGYAMGGNGALANAIMHPERYSMCVDMSGGVAYNTNLAEMMDRVTNFTWSHYKYAFGPAEAMPGSKHDLYNTAKKNIEAGIEVPVFRMYAGSEEGAIHDRVKLDAENLAGLGYDATFTEVPGYGHVWPLWAYLLGEVIDNEMPLRRAPIYAEEFK